MLHTYVVLTEIISSFTKIGIVCSFTSMLSETFVIWCLQAWIT